MADSSLSLVDAAGTTRAVDAQTVGTDFQQTITIGDGTNAGRVAAVDTDGSLYVQTNTCTTAVKTNVTSSATSVTILAANNNRRGAIVFNESTAILYLSYGTTAASLTSYSVRLPANTSWIIDVPTWTGEVRGIGAAANGFARVTDMSA